MLQVFVPPNKNAQQLGSLNMPQLSKRLGDKQPDRAGQADVSCLSYCLVVWHVLHALIGAIFLSALKRKNIVTDIGVHMTLFARFHPLQYLEETDQK